MTTPTTNDRPQDAIDVTLDQRDFRLNDAQYDAFLSVLDDPPSPNERLKRLMSEKAPWET